MQHVYSIFLKGKTWQLIRVTEENNLAKIQKENIHYAYEAFSRKLDEVNGKNTEVVKDTGKTAKAAVELACQIKSRQVFFSLFPSSEFNAHPSTHFSYGCVQRQLMHLAQGLGSEFKFKMNPGLNIKFESNSLSQAVQPCEIPCTAWVGPQEIKDLLTKMNLFGILN